MWSYSHPICMIVSLSHLILLRLLLIWWKFPGRPYLPVASCPILSLLSYHTTGTTTRALTKRGGRKRYLNGKSDRKDAKVGGTGWEENRSEEILRCTDWSSNDWPPSVSPSIQTKCLGRWYHRLQWVVGLPCLGKGACGAQLKAAWKHPLPSVLSFALSPHVLALIHNPVQLVTQPHTTYTQTKHIRFWVLNWHQTCVVCVKKWPTSNS